MICYLRASTVEYDVRLQKYIQACTETDTPYIAMTWDRIHNSKKPIQNEIQYKRYSPYGRRWKNLYNLILWQLYLLKMLIVYRHKYQAIHACNLECILPAILMKAIGKKVIFDIYDPVKISIERYLSKRFIDILILPHHKRLTQMALNEHEVAKFLEIENVPAPHSSLQDEQHHLSAQIKLSYVGVFQRNIRGLENLISEVIHNSDLTLDIAGTGSGLDETIISAAKQTPRIRYHGVVSYTKALQIMGASDFIVAMYYTSERSHLYAAPNKYYESLYLGVPVITTKGTLVGDLVTQNNAGYAIGESFNDLHNFFLTTKTTEFQNSYREHRMACRTLWKDKFEQYSENIIRGKYLRSVNEIAKL